MPNTLQSFFERWKILFIRIDTFLYILAFLIQCDQNKMSIFILMVNVTTLR